MFGYGLNDKIIRAYEWLINAYDAGDELFIFGFRGGAYTTRSLSGLIAKCGLITIGAPLSVKQLYDRYRRGSAATTRGQLLEDQGTGKRDISLEERWMLRYSQRIEIEFFGVWDTVGALGLPFGNLPILGKADMQFLNTGLRASNKFALHALAIGEHRRAFAPTLWTVDYDKGAQSPHYLRTLSQVEQRWFVGTHANVGGGCQSDLLAQAPLKWMMDKAAACGLPFRRDLDLDTRCAAPHLGFLFRADERRIQGTHIGAPFLSTDRFRAGDIISKYMRENIDETIDSSVFERWRSDRACRTPNLKECAARRKVDVSTMRMSLTAEAAAPCPKPGGERRSE